jgi:hypothetical protein
MKPSRPVHSLPRSGVERELCAGAIQEQLAGGAMTSLGRANTVMPHFHAGRTYLCLDRGHFWLAFFFPNSHPTKSIQCISEETRKGITGIWNKHPFGGCDEAQSILHSPQRDPDGRA